MPTQELHLFTNGEPQMINVFDQAEMAEAIGVNVLDLIDMLKAGVLSFFRKDESTDNHFFSEPAFQGNIKRADLLRSVGYEIRLAKDKNKGNPLPWMVVHLGEVRARYPKASQARQDAATRALGVKAILDDWTYTTKTDRWLFMPPSDLWLTRESAEATGG